MSSRAASRGRCQVVVYTPDHSCRSVTGLSGQQLIDLVAVLRDRSSALWAEGHRYVMAFENRGATVGATLDHLHGQVYALDHLPPTIHTKLARHAEHRRDEQRCLGCTLVAEDVDRVIVANDTFSVAVPYAARWPFEVHVRARPHGLGRLGDLTDSQVVDLAAALRDVVARYDGLFGKDLPYMMCVQESPTTPAGDWHLHVEFLPPNRSADLLKVRASVETALGTFINDSVPETSAARLAAVKVASEGLAGREHRPPDRGRPMTRAELVARAPGRVNLIGDHTDYTGGLCLPIAINRWVEIAGRPQPQSQNDRLGERGRGGASGDPDRCRRRCHRRTEMGALRRRRGQTTPPRPRVRRRRPLRPADRSGPVLERGAGDRHGAGPRCRGTRPARPGNVVPRR